MAFDPSQFGATPVSSTPTQPIQPSASTSADNNSFDASQFGATPAPADANAPANPAAPAEENQPSTFESIDKTLSNMPGLLGAVGSGIYNGAKSLLQLGGSAAVDAFDAVNHPIDSGKALMSFLGDEVKGGADPNSIDTLGSFIQNTLGSKGLLGVAQLPGKAINEAGNVNDFNDNTKAAAMFNNIAMNYINQRDSATNPEDKAKFQAAADSAQKAALDAMNRKSGQELTGLNVLGTSLNGALTALTFGSGNIAAQGIEKAASTGLLTAPVAQALKTAATSAVGRAAQSGALMEGFNTASNLENNRPAFENGKQAFFSGAALPGLIGGAGKAASKIIPDSITTDAGATALKKAIGFRGGNPIEKGMFDKAALVVFNELKNNGFTLTDARDPNNIINLDKAMSDAMAKILQERTDRIKSTGGDATISGDIAGKAIRNLVEPNSVEDLINPNTRTNLDAIAKNFEGKQYTPVEAQKAIVQANQGFSLSDNPALASKVKMAISQAFTPELDRIVAGKDKIAYDANGKALPAPKGTAELNKRWSALKTFRDQLQKKMIIEDRRATNSLPDRLNIPQVMGKVGEAVGNPMKVPEKIVGGSFQYLANKVLGDRNNVNYRLYKAFNGQPTGMAIIGMLNKFTRASDLISFLRQNPLILHALEKVMPYAEALKQNVSDKINPTDATLKAKPANLPNRQGGFVRIGGQSFKEIPEATKKEMIDVIDYLRIGSSKPGIEDTVSTLAKKYNVNENWSSSRMADAFEKLIEQTKTSQSAEHPVLKK